MRAGPIAVVEENRCSVLVGDGQVWPAVAGPVPRRQSKGMVSGYVAEVGGLEGAVTVPKEHGHAVAGGVRHGQVADAVTVEIRPHHENGRVPGGEVAGGPKGAVAG